MAGEKRFRDSLFGFNKSDVNLYIEKMLKEFDESLKEKDDEISNLKNQLKDIKAKCDELVNRSGQINEDRDKIAEVLIKAQEKAEIILEDARAQAMEEKTQLEKMIEQEKEKLVDMKKDAKALKSEIIKTLKKFEAQLEEIAEEKIIEGNGVEDN
jgi:cell division initiation protein